MEQDRIDAGPAGLRPGADTPAALETRRRIVETAERLFRQFGYQKTTVADIAAELSMSPANVYRFFASKSSITEAVARLLTGEIEEVAHAAATQPGLSARERLLGVIRATYRATVQRYIKDQRMHAMVHAAIDENWEVVKAHKAVILGILTELIREGIAAGEFRVEGDPAVAARCVQMANIATCHPLIIEHCLRANEDLEEMIDPMVAFCCRGLGAQG
ncbi:TetR/AcrR family transcriptional regulator [Labrys wisconsinensis]|uniref:AcrR family transcriptional regulator n=1 Tax=Labrys wisconsinensis TaxID=425677 RepID=A0ABU0JKL7_9HYPH|nr:TetR/AcrR family transcriptional regulator [Labrys wisconsinensis]MDQ0474831.1 AcrR family transcriptional regulator [Labrys wisconsinensis]